MHKGQRPKHSNESVSITDQPGAVVLLLVTPPSPPPAAPFSAPPVRTGDASNRLLLHKPPYPQQQLCFHLVRHRGCAEQATLISKRACRVKAGGGTSSAGGDLLCELLHRQLLIALGSDEICAAPVQSLSRSVR